MSSKSKQATAARYVWVRVGDGGDYSQFDSLDDAIEYLNELRVGKVEAFVSSGFATPNYWGHDYISCYWGDEEAGMVSLLDADERLELADRLEENYL
jgi:hypothetical protein